MFTSAAKATAGKHRWPLHVWQRDCANQRRLSLPQTGRAGDCFPGSNTTATITGTLEFYPGNHLFTVGSGATVPGVQDLLIDALITETSPSGGIQKEGSGRMRFITNNSRHDYVVTNAIMGAAKFYRLIR